MLYQQLLRRGWRTPLRSVVFLCTHLQPERYGLLAELQDHISNPRSPTTLGHLLMGISKARVTLTSSERANVCELISQSATSQLRNKDISLFLYSLRLWKADHRCDNVLYALTNALRSNTEKMLPYEVSLSFVGMKQLTGTSDAHLALLRSLNDKIANAPRFPPRIIAIVMFGLHNFPRNHSERLRTCSLITTKIRQCRSQLDSQCISNILYGLGGCSSDHKAVCDLLDALVPHVTCLPQPLCGLHLCNAIYGLNSMKSDSESVRNMMHALVSRADRSPSCDIVDQSISSILYGIRCMATVHSEAVLRLVCDLINVNAVVMAGRAFSISILSLRSKSADNPLVRELLGLLVSNFGSSTILTPLEICNILTGIQHMSCRYYDVRRVMHVCVKHIEINPLRFTAAEVGRAFAGLQEATTEYPYVLQLVQALTKRLYDCANDINSLTASSIMLGIGNMRTPHPELKELLLLLAEHLQLAPHAQEVSNAALFSVLRAVDINIRDHEEKMKLVHIFGSRFSLQKVNELPEDQQSYIRNMLEAATQKRPLI